MEIIFFKALIDSSIILFNVIMTQFIILIEIKNYQCFYNKNGNLILYIPSYFLFWYLIDSIFLKRTKNSRESLERILLYTIMLKL